MAINVDTVYKTVLLVLNKEQRGYITPSEFNKIATQVQLEIFEKYFEDLNQQMRVPENDSEYANRVKNIDIKTAIFKTYGDATYYDQDPLGPIANPYFFLPQNLHRLGTVIYKGEQELQSTNRAEYLHLNMSQLTRPSDNYPLYILEGEVTPEDPLNPGVYMCNNCDRIYVYPNTINTDVTVSYIRKPLNPVWAYIVDGTTGAYLYSQNADPSAIPTTGSVSFELDDTEQTNVIIRILMYAGVVIRDPQIVQAAAQEAALQEQNEKQ